MYNSIVRHKLYSYYVYSAALILLVVGIAKIFSVFGATKFQVSDPVFGVPFGDLLLSVGIMEVALALYILKNPKSTFSLGSLTIFASLLATYRVCLWWTGWQLPCGCLGSLTHVLNLSPQKVDSLTKILLVYLIVPGYWFFVFQPYPMPERQKRTQ